MFKNKNVKLIPILAGMALALFFTSCASYNTISSADGNRSGGDIESAELDQDELKTVSYPALSANLVERVINDESVEQHLEIFKNADADDLEDALDTPQKRLTFWLNIYNGYTQYFLKKDPSLYKENRSKYFNKDQIEIAGYTVSFEDIEHGVMRRGATIWSKGYIRIRLFRSEFIRRYVMDTVDYRLHFALNCGAKSCPPVVAYQTATVSKQLHMNTAFYLGKEVEYNKEENSVKAPALMKWFSADFGGNDGKRKILKEFDLIPENSSPGINYLPYDWTIQIENYKSYDDDWDLF